MKKVLSLPPPSHIELMFAPDVWAALTDEFDVTVNCEPKQKTSDELREAIGDYDAVLTGWGSPRFTREVLEAAPNLQIVAHTAGSPRAIFDDDVVSEILIPRGITVYTGANSMAHNVAEMTIGLMIMAARRMSQARSGLSRQKARRRRLATHRAGPFRCHSRYGFGFDGRAPSDARFATVRMRDFALRPVDFARTARVSWARKKSNSMKLFERSDIVSLHAPNLPATQKMIGAAQLAKLRDGACFINTSRGSVVDHDALLAECKSGRIIAALDVTEPEPLPPDSEFWNLPNVILTPHIAGQGQAGYRGIGQGALASPARLLCRSSRRRRRAAGTL